MSDDSSCRFNLSFHYHAGDKGSCWRLVGGDVPVREGCQIEPDHGPPGAGKWIEESREMAKSVRPSFSISNFSAHCFKVPKNKQVISSKPAKAAKTQQILLHGSRKGAMPVIAIVDPNNEGDWIAARIVIRLGLKHEKVDNHKTVPDIKGQSFEKTRIFVDLSCGGPEDRGACIRRFFVVNHCDVFDILIGTMIR